MGRVTRFAPVAAITAAAVVLSPWYAPLAVYAQTGTGINATQGQQVTITVPPVTQAVYVNPTNQYQYIFGLQGANGVSLPDVPIYQPQISFGSQPVPLQPIPLQNGTVTGVTYSVYGGNFPASAPSITLTPLDIGNYQFTSQLVDETTGQTVGQAVYTPLSIAAAKPTLDWQYGESDIVTNGMGNYGLDVSSLTVTDSVYYHFQILKNGAPLGPNDAQLYISPNNGPNQVAVPLVDGIGTFGGPNGVPLPPANQGVMRNPVSIAAQFNAPGTYTLIATVVDAKTGQDLGTASDGSITVHAPNVIATLALPHGTIDYNYVDATIVPPDGGQNLNAAWFTQHLSTGLYVPPSTLPYVIRQVQIGTTGGSNFYQVPLLQPQTFTVGLGSKNTFTFTMPATSMLSGKVSLSGYSAFTIGRYAQIEAFPVVNGNVQFDNPFWIPVNNDGSFQQPLENGQYWFGGLNTNGHWLTLDKTVTVNGPTSVNLGMTPISIDGGYSLLQNQRNWNQIILSDHVAKITDPVDVSVSVKTASGQPVTSGVSFAAAVYDKNGSHTRPLALNPLTGAYQNNPSESMSLENANEVTLMSKFTNSGGYVLTYTLIDAKTKQILGKATQYLEVHAPNVIGTLVAADGTTPVPYEGVQIFGPGGSWGTNATADGTVGLYISRPGLYTVTGIYTPNGTITLPIDKQTHFEVVSGQTAHFTQVNSAANVVGTAYEDAGKTALLKNGWVQFVPAGESANSASVQWLSTNASGQFVADLPAGQSYRAIAEGTNSFYERLPNSKPFQVQSNGLTSVTVSPRAADFNFPVRDALGNPVQSGYVAVVPSSDDTLNPNQLDNAKILWFQIQNGQVSGYLPDNSYVAVGISAPGNYLQIDVPFRIANGVVSPADTVISPTPAIIHGTVLDSHGQPIDGGAVLIQPVGGGQTVGLQIDENGDFTNMGWSNNGKFRNQVIPGQAYRVNGISTPHGWTPLSGITFTATSGYDLNIRVPVSDVSGSVSVNGQEVTSGWMALGPANHLDTTGAQWNWVRISNGQYQAALPKGTYIAYAIQTDSGWWTSTMHSAQQPFTIANTSQPITDDVAIRDNLTGTMTDGSSPVQGATLEISRIPNPSTPEEWNQVVNVQTDSQGHFNASLTPGTWYIVGYYAKNAYNQLGEQFTVGESGTNLPINIAPNLTGTLNWAPGTQPSVSRAWIVLRNTSSKQVLGAELQSVSSGTWSFATVLPVATDSSANQWQVIGLNLQRSNGSQTWWDMTQNSGSLFSVSSGQSTTLPLSMKVHSGTISGGSIDGSGYVVFENTTGEFVSVPYETSGGSATFSTTFDATDWKVSSVHSADKAYPVVTSAYANGAWTITVQ